MTSGAPKNVLDGLGHERPIREQHRIRLASRANRAISMRLYTVSGYRLQDEPGKHHAFIRLTKSCTLQSLVMIALDDLDYTLSGFLEADIGMPPQCVYVF